MNRHNETYEILAFGNMQMVQLIKAPKLEI